MSATENKLQTLAREKGVLVEYSGDIEPGLRVRLGETFVVETNDNWWNLLGEEGAVPDITKPPVGARQYVRGNPVNGPIHVEGVEPGDTLVVGIDDIAVRDWGWTGSIAGFGPIAGLTEWADIDEPFSTVIRHVPGPSGTLKDGEAIMNVGREVRWPLAPFIGTIVTAPERGSENTLVGQGPWGGNIDTRDIAAGNKIHLNATHDGGLLFVGDVHASQGDSELSGIADETAADITMTCDVLKNRTTPGICRIEKPDSIVQVDSARNAGSPEKALNNCFLNLMRWLVNDYGMSKREAYLHMTANSLVRINVYQFTTGFFVCGVEFPKQYL
jgi:amidase